MRHHDDRRQAIVRKAARVLLGLAVLGLAGCDQDSVEVSGDTAAQVDEGGRSSASTRSATSTLWTDTLRMHEVIETAVDPDDGALGRPEGRRRRAAAGHPADRRPEEPGHHRRAAQAERRGRHQGHGGHEGGEDRLTRVGITCALCHSTVDDSVMPGHRPAARRLAEPRPRTRARSSRSRRPLDRRAEGGLHVLGPGQVRPALQHRRHEHAGGDPAGLRAAPTSQHATYTGDGDISYWNNYVAVTQMGGQGDVRRPAARRSTIPPRTPDLVTPKLPALRDYQLSLRGAGAAGRQLRRRRGQARAARVFDGAGTLRAPATRARARTDGELHAPAGDRHGPGLRDAQRHQEVPHDAAARRCGSTRRTSTTAARPTLDATWSTTTTRTCASA